MEVKIEMHTRHLKRHWITPETHRTLHDHEHMQSRSGKMLVLGVQRVMGFGWCLCWSCCLGFPLFSAGNRFVFHSHDPVFGVVC